MGEKWLITRVPLERVGDFYIRDTQNGNRLAGTAAWKSDAHLFAASHLMLEALTRLLEIIERDDNVTHNIEYADLTILDQARAAIAAAKGE